MYRTVLMLFIIIIPLTVYPQKRKAQRAYDAWDAGEYFEAIDLFKDAYSKTRDRNEKSEYIFMVAECYRLSNNPRSAESWYKKISGRDNVRPEATYWYAETLKKNGNNTGNTNSASKAISTSISLRLKFVRANTFERYQNIGLISPKTVSELGSLRSVINPNTL